MIRNRNTYDFGFHAHLVYVIFSHLGKLHLSTTIILPGILNAVAPILVTVRCKTQVFSRLIAGVAFLNPACGINDGLLCFYRQTPVTERLSIVQSNSTACGCLTAALKSQRKVV